MAGGSQKADEPITEINITPLVDVCLVLVIIFMAVAPMAMTLGIKVLQSKAQATEGKADINENVTVTLTEDGQLLVNGAKTEPSGLREALLVAIGKSKDKMVAITADEKNRVGQVVELLDTAKQAGALKLAILKSDGTIAATGGKKS